MGALGMKKLERREEDIFQKEKKKNLSEME